MGIGVEGAGQRHVFEPLPLHYRPGENRVVHPLRHAHRNPPLQSPPDDRRLLHEAPLVRFRALEDFGHGLVGPPRHVDQVDPGPGQQGREAGRFLRLQAPLRVFRRRQPVADRVVGAGRFPDGGQHLQGEPGPVFQRAPVTVPAAVGAGGEELPQQVAVRPVEVDHVHSRLQATFRRPGEIADHPLDIGVGHFPGKGTGVHKRGTDGGGGQRTAVMHRGRGLAPAVVEFQGQVGPVFADRLRHSPQPGDHMVGVASHLIGIAPSLR